MNATPTLEMLDPATLMVDINVRKDAALTRDFIASIKEHGVMEPVIAHRKDDGVVQSKQRSPQKHNQKSTKQDFCKSRYNARRPSSRPLERERSRRTKPWHRRSSPADSRPASSQASRPSTN